MTSVTSTDTGIWSLCNRLRAEKLLIDCEVSRQADAGEEGKLNELQVGSISTLHQELRDELIRLGVAVWVNDQHQVVLRGLISSDPNITPDSATSIAKTLNSVQPIEAYRSVLFELPG